MSSESTRDPPERKTIDSGIHEPRPVPSTPSTPPAPPGDDGYRPDPDRWMALGICLAAGFMTLLDVSIVNVALPSIERGLHAQSNELEWIVAGYALALGLLLVPSGRFGDAHGGARRSWSASPYSWWPAQRAGQSLFRGEERGKAFGYFGATIGVSTAVGPLVGGALIALFGAHEGWRAVFLVNLPIGAAIMPAVSPRPARADRGRAPARGADPLGVVLLGAAVRRIGLRSSSSARGTARCALRCSRWPLCCCSCGCCTSVAMAALASRWYRSTCSGSAPTCAPVGLIDFAGFVGILHPHPVPAAGVELPRVEVRPGRHAVCPRRRAGRVVGRPPGAAPRPQALGLLACHGPRRACRRLAGRGRSSRSRRWAVDGTAAADRRPRRRARDLTQPDPHAGRGAGPARREAPALCCRPGSGSARPPASRSPAGSSTTSWSHRTATSRPRFAMAWSASPPSSPPRSC